MKNPQRFNPQACRNRVLRGGLTLLDSTRKYVEHYERVLATRNEIQLRGKTTFAVERLSSSSHEYDCHVKNLNLSLTGHFFVRTEKKTTVCTSLIFVKTAKTCDLRNFSKSARCVLKKIWLRVVVVEFGWGAVNATELVGT